MTSADEAQRYERLFEAFERGRALPEGERESWLAALAARDADLAHEVRRLLERNGAANEDPLGDAAIDAREPLGPWIAAEDGALADDALPERIGPFRVLRRLGAGGWASSTRPSKRRRAGAWP